MRSLHIGLSALCLAAWLLPVPLGHAATLLAGATLYPAPGEPDPTVGAPFVSTSVPFSAAAVHTLTRIDAGDSVAFCSC